eukprot:402971-Hanusia_phi.AAC.1
MSHALPLLHEGHVAQCLRCQHATRHQQQGASQCLRCQHATRHQQQGASGTEAATGMSALPEKGTRRDQLTNSLPQS